MRNEISLPSFNNQTILCFFVRLFVAAQKEYRHNLTKKLRRLIIKTSFLQIRKDCFQSVKIKIQKTGCFYKLSEL